MTETAKNRESEKQALEDLRLKRNEVVEALDRFISSIEQPRGRGEQTREVKRTLAHNVYERLVEYYDMCRRFLASPELPEHPEGTVRVWPIIHTHKLQSPPQKYLRLCNEKINDLPHVVYEQNLQDVFPALQGGVMMQDHTAQRSYRDLTEINNLIRSVSEGLHLPFRLVGMALPVSLREWIDGQFSLSPDKKATRRLHELSREAPHELKAGSFGILLGHSFDLFKALELIYGYDSNDAEKFRRDLYMAAFAQEYLRFTGSEEVNLIVGAGHAYPMPDIFAEMERVPPEIKELAKTHLQAAHSLSVVRTTRSQIAHNCGFALGLGLSTTFCYSLKNVPHLVKYIGVLIEALIKV